MSGGLTPCRQLRPSSRRDQDCVTGKNLKHGEPVTMIIRTLNRKLLTYIQVFTSVYSLFIVVSLAILVKFDSF